MKFWTSRVLSKRKSSSYPRGYIRRYLEVKILRKKKGRKPSKMIEIEAVIVEVATLNISDNNHPHPLSPQRLLYFPAKKVT